MSKRGHGQVCAYCKRALESVSSLSRVAATRDHVIAKSHGGRSTVWCCRQCNSIKGDMTYEAWLVFMIETPEWWRLHQFAQHGRAKTALHTKRVAMALAAAEVLSEPTTIPNTQRV